MLQSQLQDALFKQGIQNLTTLQLNASTAISTGSNAILSAPTGTGKTLAFLLPVFELSLANAISQTLILAPTTELIIQILDQIRLLINNSQLPITAISLIGHPDRIAKALRQKKPNIIVSTPERALEFIKQNKIKSPKIKTIVIDEADYFFRNEHKNLVEKIISSIPAAQIVLCSATLDTNNFQFLESPTIITDDNHINQNISHKFVITEHRKKYDTLKNLLNQYPSESMLIFINNTYEAKIIYDKLVYNGFQTSLLIGNQNKEERTNSLRNFRNNKTRILISSDLSARGLDIPNISHIINLDLPPNSNSYIHRSGRCARFGRSGISLCIITKGEIKTINDYEKDLLVTFSQIKKE
ncbi:MAG: hypothetical protein ATN31_10530 [Candidatus Epulonipiscioides saccharophilum]|nr:MAG: hypothetical protein ATN31_10530 [Epulopiscium sp. AS2M-Bin001]